MFHFGKSRSSVLKQQCYISHMPLLSLPPPLLPLSPLPLLSPSPPLPPPAFAAPVVGWLLRCCPPSTIVIARRHATIKCSRCRPLLPPIVVHRRHRHRCCCRRAATASTATTVVKLAVVHCKRKRQQQQQHQHTNGSTSVKTFTSPDDWTYLTYIYSIEGI